MMMCRRVYVAVARAGADVRAVDVGGRWSTPQRLVIDLTVADRMLVWVEFSIDSRLPLEAVGGLDMLQARYWARELGNRLLERCDRQAGETGEPDPCLISLGSRRLMVEGADSERIRDFMQRSDDPEFDALLEAAAVEMVLFED